MRRAGSLHLRIGGGEDRARRCGSPRTREKADKDRIQDREWSSLKNGYALSSEPLGNGPGSRPAPPERLWSQSPLRRATHLASEEVGRASWIRRCTRRRAVRARASTTRARLDASAPDLARLGVDRSARLFVLSWPASGLPKDVRQWRVLKQHRCGSPAQSIAVASREAAGGLPRRLWFPARRYSRACAAELRLLATRIEGAVVPGRSFGDLPG